MTQNSITTEINVQNHTINVLRVGNIDYISLSDIAKSENSTEQSFTIKNWLRKTDTINYLGLWEKLHNNNFNLVEFDQIKTEYGRNAFSMSPSQWIKRPNAVGIVSKGGRYSIGRYICPSRYCF